MAHVFEGEPDGRQAKEPIQTSRFRPRYRQLSDEEKALHDLIKAKAAELEALMEQAEKLRLPEMELENITEERLMIARSFELSMQRLEESIFWTIKGLTA